MIFRFIQFDVFFIFDTSLIFRIWHYAIVLINFFWQKTIFNVCVDTSCIMFLIDRRFLNDLKLSNLMKKFKIFIVVRNIEIVKYIIDDYLLFFIYVKKQIDDQFVVVHFRRKIHVINNLKIKLLLKINVMNSKRMIIDLNQRQFFIKNCQNLTTKLEIIVKNNVKLRRIIKVKKKLVVETNFIVQILIITRKNFLFDKNYLFESYFVNVYVHVTNSSLSFVCVKNNLIVLLNISRHVKLNNLTKFEKQSCYQINSNEYVWVVKKKIKINIFDIKY